MPRLVTAVSLCLSSLVSALGAVFGFELWMKSAFQDWVVLAAAAFLVFCIGAMWFAFRRRRDGFAWLAAALPMGLIALAFSALNVRVM